MQARRLRAKLRWARLRASLAALVSAHAAACPMVPPRIAGPATIRTAFVQRPEVRSPSCCPTWDFGKMLAKHPAALHYSQLGVCIAPH